MDIPQYLASMLRRVAAGSAVMLVAMLPTFATPQAGGGKSTEDANCGIVYGDAHAFTVCAPKGWVLDNTIMHNQGIYAVFYPTGTTWNRAKENGTVMYVNTTRKLGDNATVAEDTLRHAPAAKIIKGEVIPTQDGDGDALVQKFEHGAFDRFEAVAYLDSPKIIVMVVMTSASPDTFNRDYPAFQELVKSYRFLSSTVTFGHAAQQPPDWEAEQLKAARKAVEKNMLTAEGHQYDGKFGTEFGKKYPAVMKRCTEAAGNDTGAFDLFLRVDEDGKVKDVLMAPATKVAVCLRQQLLQDEFPPPPGPSYWVNINMSIQP